MRLRIDVEGLHCAGCAETLREAVSPSSEARVARIDVDEGYLLADLQEDSGSREALLEAVEEAGFSVQLVERAPAGDDEEATPPRGGAGGYLAFVLLVLLLAVVGYAGYALYPRFGLPAVEGAAVLLLAAGAGVASFFSPCAFGLLVTLLARETGAGESRRGLARALAFAAGLSAGAAAFVMVVGLVIGLGGAGLVGGVTFTSTAGWALRLAVGAALVLLGLIQLELLPNPLHRVADRIRPLRRLSARERRQRPFLGDVLFGFGYLLAGFG